MSARRPYTVLIIFVVLFDTSRLMPVQYLELGTTTFTSNPFRFTMQCSSYISMLHNWAKDCAVIQLKPKHYFVGYISHARYMPIPAHPLFEYH
jgi:hypothetical protein